MIIFFTFDILFLSLRNLDGVICKRKTIEKTLNISFYICYIGEKMNQAKSQKSRLGRKEKAVLDFLAKHPEGIWKDEVIRHFSWASKYDGVVNKRLQNLEKKGLIEIRYELNPESGRSKQRVYLVK